ncbi:MAG: GMC family oxidoreductase [Gammaproteobacteria bacterium]|jgi:choline dehydrogenase-like flavoprotein|nr:GMC family oxidoreductase [Gammaproteobacteria bacterium]MBT3695393.1 GMC family oxidoreductase [Gammaproteobacteria bacterium]MBT5683008.1 GMC family oxidoreductase [Gammaproteobacteria bacterium]MBT6026168.1 GMC family oxidoreductase [Gammaproteobacteria bacterium]MBT6556787.1 GMC family oxidoreductase [Gammaproteobacteria bacterium]
MSVSSDIDFSPADVLIIGAGASGATAAWNLAETKMRIVCLEQGGWTNPSNYPTTGRDWESRAQSDFSINPNRRQQPGDYPVNDDDSPIKIANFNGVGGGTVLYAGHYPRFHPSDFKVKSLDGVADDWPIDYGDLEPFYAENDRITGVSGLAGDPAYPAKQSLMPPLPMGKSGQKLAEGFNQLGWHWWPSDSAIATQPYNGRDQCINLGACIYGCAQGAKASTDITYWPEAVRAGVELRTWCRVKEINVGDDGLASGVTYFDEDGVEQFQPAHVVIMACNGVGTPRILLNSVSKQFPDGLANSSGLVGKNLMLHPYASIQGVFEEPLDGYRGPHDSIWSQEFYETGEERDFIRGFTYETTRGRGLVATALTGVHSGRIPWGAGHHDAYRKLHNRIAGMVAICEDLPEEHNSVTLDPSIKDAHGIPAPKMTYSISDNSQKMLDFAVARATETLRAAGATDVIIESPLASGGWHLMGTARMGKDPQKSVVNEWGRSHDVKNLFIVDGSIFVTSAGVNPTRTIQTLALYITDQIKKRLTHLFD